MYDEEDLETATKVCVPEIWQVALGQKDLTINRYQRELIYQSIERLGWKVNKTKQARFGVFGHQRPITTLAGEDNLPF